MGAVRARRIIQGSTRLLRLLAMGVLDLAYPPVCAGCRETLRYPGASRPAVPLCTTCWEGIPVVGAHVCLRCGLPQGPHVGSVERCAGCPSDFGGIRETVSLGRYLREAIESLPQESPAAQEVGEDEEEPLDHASESTSESAAPGVALLRQMILQLKYSRGLESATVLGHLLAGEVALRSFAGGLDWIVPVPLHWRRQLERRYNQADLIATALSKRLGVPKVSLLVRTRHTESQTTLPRYARATNVEGAFALAPRWRRWLAGTGTLSQRRVLLVDDLLTTGATLGNCARTLKQAGIQEVYAAVAARA